MTYIIPRELEESVEKLINEFFNEKNIPLSKEDFEKGKNELLNFYNFNGFLPKLNQLKLRNVWRKNEEI